MPKNKPGELVTRVLELLRERPRSMTYKQIADDTQLPEGWLKIFATGNIDDPSVNRVELLYNYLSGQSLDV